MITREDIEELFVSIFDRSEMYACVGLNARTSGFAPDTHADADRFIEADEQDRQAIREEMAERLKSRIARLAKEAERTKPNSIIKQIREWQLKNTQWQRSYESAYRERNRERLRLAATARRARAKAAA